MKLHFKNQELELLIEDSNKELTNTEISLFWEMCKDLIDKNNYSKPLTIFKTDEEEDCI